jgi:hypothetical protein
MLSVRTQQSRVLGHQGSHHRSNFVFFMYAEVFQMQHSYCMVSSIETKYWLCCWHVKLSIWCVIGSLRELRPRVTTSIHYPSLLVNTNFTFLSHLYRCNNDYCHKLVWPKGPLLLYWSHRHIYSSQSIDCGTPPLQGFKLWTDFRWFFPAQGWLFNLGFLLQKLCFWPHFLQLIWLQYTLSLKKFSLKIGQRTLKIFRFTDTLNLQGSNIKAPTVSMQSCTVFP